VGRAHTFTKLEERALGLVAAIVRIIQKVDEIKGLASCVDGQGLRKIGQGVARIVQAAPACKTRNWSPAAVQVCTAGTC
jgi:hypothetical protein